LRFIGDYHFSKESVKIFVGKKPIISWRQPLKPLKHTLYKSVHKFGGLRIFAKIKKVRANSFDSVEDEPLNKFGDSFFIDIQGSKL
jgi:hypothetical protein